MNITLDGGALGETELRLLCNFVTIRGNACLANYQANAGGNVRAAAAASAEAEALYAFACRLHDALRKTAKVSPALSR
jgi:hypothetical protein